MGSLPLRSVRTFLETLTPSASADPSVALHPRERAIADPLLRAVIARLGFLIDVGLDYLTLDRSAQTLSGGEGQRIRLAGQGEAGLRGAPSGDLYVTVHVRPDKVFGRDGDDLTVTVPVSFTELALGTTLSVPTLEGKVGVRVPKGTADGRILRVRGRGVPKRSGGHGDLLVTVKVAVPPNLEGSALEALEAYAAAERSSGFDPRAGWVGNRA